MSNNKSPLEIIFSMKSQNVIVQLKSGFTIRGILENVDYFLNLKLRNITATDKELKTFHRANEIFLRGNLISSIILEKDNLPKTVHISQDKTKQKNSKNYEKNKKELLGKLNEEKGEILI